MRLLIVKTTSMGDVVHALPALTDIRRAFPSLHVDWLVEQPFAAIPALHPGVQRRWLLVLGLSCFTLPYLAELAGLLPRSYEFTGDTWITRASLTSLPPIASATVLWIGSAAGVVIQVLSITTIRDSLAAAQRRLALQAWQLDQLVPRGQREVVT